MSRRASHVIEPGRVVTLVYTLRDAAGELLDSSEQSGPLVYLHGRQGLLPALEQALEGRSAGERLALEIPPELAYGALVPKGEQVLPRSAFPDSVELEEGLPLASQGPDGRLHALFVTQIEADRVVLDRNHPLAGLTLCFEIEIVAVRDASAREHRCGHPERADGAHLLV